MKEEKVFTVYFRDGLKFILFAKKCIYASFMSKVLEVSMFNHLQDVSSKSKRFSQLLLMICNARFLLCLPAISFLLSIN